jgi:hypothetical protein
VKRSVVFLVVLGCLVGAGDAGAVTARPYISLPDAQRVSQLWARDQWGAGENGSGVGPASARCARHSRNSVACAVSFHVDEGPYGGPGTWHMHVTVRRSRGGFALSHGWDVYRWRR